MLAAMIVRSLRLDVTALKYLPTSSGKEALDALASGKASVGISGYSEFSTAIASKSIVTLGVSSAKPLFGIPSLRSQGMATELANWRAVFAPVGLKPEEKDALRAMVIRATESAAWRQTLLENNWVGSLLYGKELDRFMEFEQGISAVVTSMLKLHS
ncbi:MAG: hypothetical protein M1823_006351 [Watsoniomyces obsoletus]|nr:MAG: hypothetical protein M1823_006351 [Watsoniomyces obsoletus]